MSTSPRRGGKGKKRDHDDAPLALRYRSKSLAEYIPRPEVLTNGQREVAGLVLTEAWLHAHGDGEAICTPRDLHHFTGRRSPYTFRRVVPAIDWLVRTGMIDMDKATPFPGGSGRATVITLSGRAYDVLPHPGEVDDIEAEAPPPVIVRDEMGTDIIPNRQEWLRVQARIMAPIREAALAQRIDIPTVARSGPIWTGTAPSGETYYLKGYERSPHRIFNVMPSTGGRKRLGGGRVYGLPVQNVPKEHRAAITINGETTAEPDHPQLHPRMLYRVLGLDPPRGDIYDIPGLARPLDVAPETWRDILKRSLNTMINAPTDLSQYRAIADFLSQKWRLSEPFRIARRIIEAISTAHAPIARFFGTGAGLWLMNCDSEMALATIGRVLDRHGVAPISLHDGFLVPAKYEGETREAMEAAWVVGLATAEKFV